MVSMDAGGVTACGQFCSWFGIVTAIQENLLVSPYGAAGNQAAYAMSGPKE